MPRSALLLILGSCLTAAGCGDDALGTGNGDATDVDAPAHDAATDAPIDAAPTRQIKHVVVIVQENHTFDTYFGRWCTAPAGSAPTCAPTTPRKIYTGVTTIADLLLAHGNSFADYAQGYAAMKAAFLCPAAPADCPLHLPTTPCDYDPSDVPFEYYAQFRDDEATMKDYDDFAADVTAHRLPDVAFIKHLGYRNEHPGYGTIISQGVDQVAQTVATITASPYAADTLILLTWDEGGGFFDHITPPPANPVDDQPYGTRVPLLALGRFARHGAVSHVVLEHSSVVKFLEWNFLGATGQLGARDTNVNNLGSLLDPATTGVPVPEQ